MFVVFSVTFIFGLFKRFYNIAYTKWYVIISDTNNICDYDVNTNLLKIENYTKVQ